MKIRKSNWKLKRKKYYIKKLPIPIRILIILIFVISSVYIGRGQYPIGNIAADSVSLDEIPEYEGFPYIEINNNIPYFEEGEMETKSYERYSALDFLGRCGPAYANLSQKLMPTEERGSIGMIKPSGWHSVKYPEQIEDVHLYNRCHLIAWCLSGENANERNLITGTRYMNTQGMLPFEEKVADYIDRTNHHVLYRVTPIYNGNDLVAEGVLMEAYSVEDKGKGITFCVYCYNVQPGIEIDYSTGESRVAE